MGARSDVCAGTAEAFEVICEGTMGLADCSPAGQVAWPVSSRQTFSAKCKACPSPSPSFYDGGTLSRRASPRRPRR